MKLYYDKPLKCMVCDADGISVELTAKDAEGVVIDKGGFITKLPENLAGKAKCASCGAEYPLNNIEYVLPTSQSEPTQTS